jgi:hypothetical protein
MNGMRVSQGLRAPTLGSLLVVFALTNGCEHDDTAVIGKGGSASTGGAAGEGGSDASAGTGGAAGEGVSDASASTGGAAGEDGGDGTAGGITTAGSAGTNVGSRDANAGIVWIGKELLGRPTDHSITVKAIADQAIEVYFEYGTSSGSYSLATSPQTFSDGAIETVIAGLSSNARYYYRMRYRSVGSTGAFSAGAEHFFHTQRAPTETFKFAIQSDAHLVYSIFNKPSLYTTTMENIAAARPDFLLDLGDAIDMDDDTETTETARTKYLDQRGYFEILGHSSPVFLVLGNHEREEGWNLDDFGADVAASLPVLSANARKRYFVNPVPDTFYSGNSEPVPEIDGDHLRGDYYAFEWGNALFVAIDPYWYTMTKPFSGATGGEKDDEVVGTRWDWTLGKQQYLWLKETLENSHATFKFVFAHQEVGGINEYGRGGALGARFCEWGGDDTDASTYSFDTNRAGWGLPIHQLLVQTRVTAFFHGHDHLYAKEVLDGVLYQAVPMPANANYNTGISSDNDNTMYSDTVTIANSGYLLVTVAPTGVTVEYVSSYLEGDGKNGSVADCYTL